MRSLAKGEDIIFHNYQHVNLPVAELDFSNHYSKVNQAAPMIDDLFIDELMDDLFLKEPPIKLPEVAHIDSNLLDEHQNVRMITKDTGRIIKCQSDSNTKIVWSLLENVPKLMTTTCSHL